MLGDLQKTPEDEFIIIFSSNGKGVQPSVKCCRLQSAFAFVCFLLNSSICSCSSIISSWFAAIGYFNSTVLTSVRSDVIHLKIMTNLWYSYYSNNFLLFTNKYFWNWYAQVSIIRLVDNCSMFSEINFLRKFINFD